MRALLSSKIFFALYLVAMVLFLSELGARVYFALEIGPRVLAYGSDWYRNNAPDPEEKRRREIESDAEYARRMEEHLKAEARDDSVEKHGNARGPYSKFFPNESKSTRDADTGERIPVKINSHGFRGREYTVEKPAGVVRIVTLGSSSTFGYYDRDDETYPHYLETYLNERCQGARTFEVINFGIPHMSSGQIADLFLAEAVPLKPDVVTFYEGRNDSSGGLEPGGLLAKLRAVLIHRSILAAYIDQVLVGEREAIDAGNLRLDVAGAEYSRYFLGNLERIRSAAEANGILLIVANQQATAAAAYPRPPAERQSMHGVTYQDETGAIRARLERGESISMFEYQLLIHEQMMLALEKWAKENSVEFVDLIGALNQDRDGLLSWVHLTPASNRMIARALSDSLVRRFCPDRVEPGPTGSR